MASGRQKINLTPFPTTRGLFGLHGRRSQHRREFLDQWDPARIDDDLWLEVAIRHLWGTSLPAHVIRTAMKYPHSSQGLADLSELWELFEYDPCTRTVRWRKLRSRSGAARKLARHWPFIRYMVFACIGMGATDWAPMANGLGQWVFSVFAMIMGVGAVLSLCHSDVEKTATCVSERWISLINMDAAPKCGLRPEQSNETANVLKGSPDEAALDTPA